MSIIEEAAKRLEELDRAGVAVPWMGAKRGAGRVLQDVDDSARTAPATSAGAASPRSVPASVEEPPRVDVVLDIEALQRAGELVPADSGCLQAEELRGIKRPLLRNARSRNAAAQRLPLIMVTSALPGEGKTFFALNLALSLATEIDLSVLLVDADVLLCDAMRRLGVAPGPGLLDLLSDPTLTLDGVVLKTNVPKLSLLRSGQRRSLSTELLASSAMDALLNRLANDRAGQVVVFDAPPLLLTNQAKVLAAHLGQIVVVVEAGSTQRSAVQQAFALLEPCPIVMSVLNKSRPEASGDGHGYGYGYGA